MKKSSILYSILISIITLTACTNNTTETDTESLNNTTIEIELDEDYDDSDPFINEELFCVVMDLDNVNAKGHLQMDAGKGILEIKNNETKEVLWSDTWEGNVNSETFSILLSDLKKDDEYVISIVGTNVKHIVVDVSFDTDLVQERVRPLSKQ